LHFGVRRWVVVRPVVGAGVALAVFEPAAVAVRLADVNVMGEAIEQRAGETLGGENAGQSSKGRLLVTIVEPRS
jgi:hypothetical protein